MIKAQTIIEILHTLIAKRNLMSRIYSKMENVYITDCKEGLIYLENKFNFNVHDDKYVIGLYAPEKDKFFVYVQVNSQYCKIEVSESVYLLIKLKIVEIYKILDEELEDKINNLVNIL